MSTRSILSVIIVAGAACSSPDRTLKTANDGGGGTSGSAASGATGGGAGTGTGGADTGTGGAGTGTGGSGGNATGGASGGGGSAGAGASGGVVGTDGGSAPSKPYFMLVVDTSGSMIGCTNPSTSQYQFPNSCPGTAPVNSCGMEPTRINDAKCALRNTVQAFGGEVNFGLETFAVFMSGCTAGTCGDVCTAADGTCTPSSGVGTLGEYYASNGCTVSAFASAPATGGNPNDSTFTGPSCGNSPNCSTAGPTSPPNLAKGTWHNAGSVVVPLQQDPTWAGATPPASNVPELLKWFDGNCDESKELFAIGLTPLAGSLQTVREYLVSGWSPLWSATNYCASTYANPPFFSTPVTDQDQACRSVNVILVTDGDPNCNTDVAATQAAASALYNTGVTFGGNTFKVPVFVVNFAGGNQTNTDAIAVAGGTNLSLSANNDVGLSQALSSIISSAIRPDVCNVGADN